MIVITASSPPTPIPSPVAPPTARPGGGIPSPAPAVAPRAIARPSPISLATTPHPAPRLTTWPSAPGSPPSPRCPVSSPWSTPTPAAPSPSSASPNSSAAPPSIPAPSTSIGPGPPIIRIGSRRRSGGGWGNRPGRLTWAMASWGLPSWGSRPRLEPAAPHGAGALLDVGPWLRTHAQPSGLRAGVRGRSENTRPCNNLGRSPRRGRYKPSLGREPQVRRRCKPSLGLGVPDVIPRSKGP